MEKNQLEEKKNPLLAIDIIERIYDIYQGSIFV